MSATGRSDVRRKLDYYPTPAWCVHRLMEALDLPGGRWLEPCAGEGAIIKAIGNRKKIDWTAVEINKEAEKELRRLDLQERRVQPVIIGDFLKSRLSYPFDVAITNPPYGLAEEVILKCLDLAKITVMLLRINFLGAVKRHEFFQRGMPDVYVLPNRPSFTGKGTDATEYAWMVWTQARSKYDTRFGTIQRLALTPKEEREGKRLIDLL